MSLLFINKLITLFIFFVLLFLSPTAFARNLIVSDGKSFKINSEKFRLWGIDTPDLYQRCSINKTRHYACGKASKTALEAILLSGKFTCTKKDTDQYNHSLVICYTEDGLDIGRILVQSGWALDYRIESEGSYQKAEHDAATNKRGLWKGRFQNPSVWRKQAIEKY